MKYNVTYEYEFACCSAFSGREAFAKFYKEMKNIYRKNGLYMIVEGVKLACFLIFCKSLLKAPKEGKRGNSLLDDGWTK